MSCEKQFLPANNTFLYCSEACRVHDQAPTYTRSQSYSTTPITTSPPQSPYTRHFSSLPQAHSPDDGPDIIPRFSPTQSRPRSYFNSDPYPTSYQTQSTIPSTPPTQTHSHSTIYTNSKSSTALASLRELATALPKSSHSRNSHPESPPKSSASSISRTGSGVWNYMPFTTTKTTPHATPGNSYTNGYPVSQSYNAYPTTSSYGGRKEEYGAAAKSYGYTAAPAAGYGNTGGMGMDRPLPPRSGPGGYGHRPKSIDLVTPYGGH